MEQEKIKKLNELNKMIKVILDTAFERNDYFFSDKEKNAIQSFRKKLFEISIEEMESIPEVQEVLKIIIKIQKFSIKGRPQETEFIEKVFPKEDIINALEKHIEKTYISKNKLNEEDIKNLDNILNILVDFNIEVTPSIEKSIKLLEDNNVNITHTKFMKTYIEKFAEGHMIQTNSDDKRFELVYKYIDILSKEDRFNLFDSDELSDIMQILKRIPQERAEIILRIINQNLKLDDIDVNDLHKRMQDFIKKYDSKIVTDETEFDKFLEDVQNLKLIQKDTMSPETIRFILNQFLNNDSIIARNKEKYKGLLKRTIEDISANDLKQFRITGCCFFRKRYGQNISAGQAIQPLFMNIIDEKIFDDFFYNRNFSVINTIYHENTHLDQYCDLYLKSNLDITDLRKKQLKEEIIKKYNPEYYIANYQLMFQEIEARERGYIKTLELLNSLKINGFDDLKRNLQNKIMIEQSNYILAKYKKKGINATEKVSVDTYFNELVEEYPEIINQYPILFKENRNIGK